MILSLGKVGVPFMVCVLGILLAANSAFAQQQAEPEELPVPAEVGSDQSQQEPAGEVQTVPEISSSLQAGLEAYRRAEQQRLDAVSRQLGLNNEMRWRSALPPWQAYYTPSVVAQSRERAYGHVGDPAAVTLWSNPSFSGSFAAPPVSLADSIMQSPWSPWSNTDIFGYRYDNPVRQPVGMTSAQTGPNTWESRPVYADEFSTAVSASTVANPGVSMSPELAARSEIAAAKDQAAARNRAFAALENADFAAALEEASLLLQFDASNSEAMFLSMHADLGLMHFADAVLDLDQALANAPPQDWNLIVRDYKLYYRTPGAFTKQLRKAESAVRDAPTDTDARLILGYLYAGLGYAKEADTQLREVKRLAEPNTTASQLADRLLQEVQRAGELPLPPAADDGAAQQDLGERQRKRIF